MSSELKVNGDDSDVYHDQQRLPAEIANEIWYQFFPRLADFARRKLGSLPRREMDEEDVAMSAIHSFFDGVNQGKFEIAERDDLWKLLATITVRKIKPWFKQHAWDQISVAFRDAHQRILDLMDEVQGVFLLKI